MNPTASPDVSQAVIEAYLPRTLIEHWAESAYSARIWSSELDGCLMLCDMSGFTAMSERLARLGKEGAELMAGILNGFFSRMLGIADAWGGFQMKFGGDAMLLYFGGDERTSRRRLRARDAARHAGVCERAGRGRAPPVADAHRDAFGDVLRSLRRRGARGAALSAHRPRRQRDGGGRRTRAARRSRRERGVRARSDGVRGEACAGRRWILTRDCGGCRARGGSGNPGETPRDILLQYILPPLAE